MLIDPLWTIPDAIPGPPGRDSVVPGPPGKDSTVPGPKGDGYRWRGEYSRVATYLPNDTVEFEGSTFVCVRESKGRSPDVSKSFELMAKRGEKGARGADGGPGQRGRAYPAWLIEQRVQDLEAEVQSLGGVTGVSAQFVDAVSKGMAIRIDDDSAVHLAISQLMPDYARVRYWGCDGLALGDVAAGGTGSYATDGIIEMPDWSAVTGTVFLSPGSSYLVSETEPGKLVKFDSTGSYFVKQIIGTALSSTRLDIEIATASFYPKRDAEFDSESKAGMFVYVSSDAPPYGHVDNARADDLATAAAVGMTYGNPAAGNVSRYLMYGSILDPKKDWTVPTGAPALVPGPYWLSTTDAGKMTNIEPTTPGHYRVKLGEAMDDNTFFIRIDPPILIE